MGVSQASLFPELGDGGRALPGGWIPAMTMAGRTVGWSHPGAPGILVRHCGHPTALRPYYLTGVAVSRKFHSLADAKAAALNPAKWIAETEEWNLEHN